MAEPCRAHQKQLRKHLSTMRLEDPELSRAQLRCVIQCGPEMKTMTMLERCMKLHELIEVSLCMIQYTTSHQGKLQSKGVNRALPRQQ